jgi:hypothetical protein
LLPNHSSGAAMTMMSATLRIFSTEDFSSSSSLIFYFQRGLTRTDTNEPLRRSLRVFSA